MRARDDTNTTPAFERGSNFDGSGSRRWRLRLVRPIGRIRGCGRQIQRRHRSGKRPRLLGETQKLETLGHAKLGAGLVFVTVRTMIAISSALHHRGTVVQGRRGNTVLTFNRVGRRMGHRHAHPRRSARPRRHDRRDYDRDRDEHTEHGAIKVQRQKPPRTTLDLES